MDVHTDTICGNFFAGLEFKPCLCGDQYRYASRDRRIRSGERGDPATYVTNCRLRVFIIRKPQFC